MLKKTRFKFIKGYRISLLIIVFLIGMITMETLAKNKADKNRTLQLRKQVPIGSIYHGVGRTWHNLTNFGFFGDATMETPSMEWPGGSGNAYLYQGSIWVAARDELGTIHCSAGDENEFYPFISDSRLAAWGDGGLEDAEIVVLIASSEKTFNITDEGAIWFDADLYGVPGKDDDGDGAVDEDPLDYLDNDGDGLWNEDFAMVSEEDAYVLYNDLNETYHEVGTPLGIEIVERSYAWSYSYAQDFIVYDFEIKNVGLDVNQDGDADYPQNLTDVYIAIRYDFDISFNAGGEYWYDDLTEYLASDKLSYGYDADDQDVPGNDMGEYGISTGYLGVRTLDTSIPDKQGRKGVPCSHNWWTIDDDPSSEELKFQFMSNENFSARPPSEYDYRFLQAVGPFDLPADSSIHYIMATAVGEGLGGRGPDPHAIKGSLRDALAWAQEMYDAGWKAATPPPKPTVNITLEPDGVVMDWSGTKDLVEDYADPLSGEKDFEGYKVYKSDRVDPQGGRIWIPLAVYDKTGDGVGGETGLEYRYEDKDVVKGFTYYYAVTSFDKGVAGLGVLESAKGTGIAVDVANPIATTLDEIAVVPNPYRGGEIWDHVPTFFEQWEHKLQFINLPARASINVYSLTGDHIVTLEQGEAGDTNSFEDWDLITRNDQRVVTGIYMYVVEDKDTGKSTVGKFVVMR